MVNPRTGTYDFVKIVSVDEMSEVHVWCLCQTLVLSLCLAPSLAHESEQDMDTEIELVNQGMDCGVYARPWS